MQSSQRLIAALAGGTLSTALAASAALAQDVSVTLNGNPVALAPAPITREGRVFVPLRGVFERLGASVVYAGGTINAQGNGHSVSLHIGSNDAVVDGNHQTLDVAPFIVGASTFVPLRFVSQALGAQVNYDASNRIVALSSGGAPPNEVIPARPQPPRERVAATEQRPPAADVRIDQLRPADGSTVRASRPEIAGRFSQPVDANSVRILLDGRDVTNTSYLSAQQFTFTPDYDLPAQRHVVRIEGKTRDGARFERRFDFTSGAGVAANFVRVENPANGAAIDPNAFRVRGQTLPNSKVRIAATGNVAGNGALILRDTYTTDVTANGDGRFDADVPLRDAPGGNVTLEVQSVSPDGQGATAREQLRVR